jgi:hypothetical protein
MLAINMKKLDDTQDLYIKNPNVTSKFGHLSKIQPISKISRLQQKSISEKFQKLR